MLFDYRTALEGAMTEESLIGYLHQLQERYEDDITIDGMIEHIDKLGIFIQEYETIISNQRTLIEDAYEFMTLNTFKQKVPRDTLQKFKAVMGNVASIVRKNKHDRKTNTN